MTWYIYGLREDKTDSSYRYIGYTTVNPENRLSLHLHAAKKSEKPYAIYNWIRSVTYDIVIEVIEECPETVITDLYDREIHWIAYYRELHGDFTNKRTPNYLFNQTDGGGGAYGYKHTEEELERRRNRVGPWAGISGPDHPLYGRSLTDEQRAKTSEWQRANAKHGEDHPRFGIKASEETRRKQSEAKRGEKHWAYGTGGPTHYNSGRVLSEEHRNKISQGNKGKVRSEETRRKMSESNSGEKNHRYGKPSHNRGVPMSKDQKDKLSVARSGKPNKGAHSRWHTKREIIDPKCIFCTEGMNQ